MADVSIFGPAGHPLCERTTSSGLRSVRLLRACDSGCGLVRKPPFFVYEWACKRL